MPECFPDSPISTTQPVEHLVFGKYPLTVLKKSDKAIWTPASVEKIDAFCELHGIRKKADIPETIAALRIQCHEDPALFTPEWNEWMDGKFFTKILAVARDRAQSLQQTEHRQSCSDLPKSPFNTREIRSTAENHHHTGLTVSIPIPHRGISEAGDRDGVEVSFLETDIVDITEVLLPSKVESLRTEAYALQNQLKRAQTELRRAASDRDDINEELENVRKECRQYEFDIELKSGRIAQAAWEDFKEKLSRASGSVISEGKEFTYSHLLPLNQLSSSERIAGSFPTDIEEEDPYDVSDDDADGALIPRTRITTPLSRDPVKEYPGLTLFDEVGRQAVRESLENAKSGACPASDKDVANAEKDRYKQGLRSSRHASVPDQEQARAAIKLVHDRLFHATRNDPVFTGSILNSINGSGSSSNLITDDVENRMERKVIGLGSRVDTTAFAPPAITKGLQTPFTRNQPCHSRSEFPDIVDGEDSQFSRQLRKREEFFKIVENLEKWCDEKEKERAVGIN